MRVKYTNRNSCFALASHGLFNSDSKHKQIIEYIVMRNHDNDLKPQDLIGALEWLSQKSPEHEIALRRSSG